MYPKLIISTALQEQGGADADEDCPGHGRRHRGAGDEEAHRVAHAPQPVEGCQRELSSCRVSSSAWSKIIFNSAVKVLNPGPVKCQTLVK